ncbi:MAG: hypothetical protein JSS66_01320 [Armatimonadetes bacterium]|nr:hypothetical protein [Armatimonadota bacterium]
MLSLAVSLAVAFLHPAPLQDPPTFGKQTYNIQPENWIEYTTVLEPQEERVIATAYCASPCRGKKHALHEACDKSCDGPCTAIHKFKIGVSSAWIPGKEIANDGQKMGLPNVTFPIIQRIHEVLKNEFKGKEKSYDLKHWCTDPCSVSYRYQNGKTYLVKIKYQFFRNDPGPNGTKILVKGPAGTCDYGSITVPVGDLSEPKTDVKCLCSVVQTEKEGAGVWIEQGGKETFATSKTIDDMGIKVECTSMDSCSVSCTNTSAQDCTVTIGAGTCFECEDGSAQNEAICETVTFKCPGLASASVPVRVSLNTPDPVSALTTSVTARAACLNMRKHEPKAGLAYRIALPSDPGIVPLAKMVEQEHFKGPWDQVRFWILTDRASKEEMGRILLPRPTYGMMLRGLYEVHTATMTDLGAAEFKNCFEPSAAIGASASTEATDWFVDEWASKDPKVLAGWLTKNTAELTKECFSDDSGSDEAAHAADLFNALCRSGNADLIEAAATCLLKAVPDGKRKLLADANGLTGLMNLLSSTDGKAASRALDVGELYRDKSILPALLNVNDTHLETIKERADKLYKEISLAEKTLRVPNRR